jgi:hypothetical protein
LRRREVQVFGRHAGNLRAQKARVKRWTDEFRIGLPSNLSQHRRRICGEKESTMSTSFEAPVLLTVRGTLNPTNLESARVMHNETAGSERGIAAARSLGDLSHKVFAPSEKAGAISSAKPGELLFIDNWMNPKGLMEFFSDHNVQEQGARLFSSKEPTVWMPARGAFTFHLPAAMSQPGRFVGLFRAKVTSPETAIEAFRAVQTGSFQEARRRGQMSHELYIKLNPPGVEAPVEVLGVDTWSNFSGLVEQYSDRGKMAPIGAVLAGAPDATVWEQAPGQWSEW